MSEKLQYRMNQIKHKFLVLSGKGGVGKSTVASQVALTFANKGLKVAILDIDLTGPSIPKILGIKNKEIYESSEGWVPVKTDNPNLKCMSIGFLLGNKDDAVIWRGPKKNAMIKQFCEDVFWEELDVLIVDTPPGTSDEHITIAELMNKCSIDGCIIVTTPQGVSLSDVRKEINFCKKLKLPICGIIENMNGYACPCCDEITYIFSKGGGELLSKHYDIPLLGSIPIDPKLSFSEDEGIDFVLKYPDSIGAKSIGSIVEKIISSYSIKPESNTK